MSNKIYHVKRTDKVDWDEYSDYVVIASSRDEALMMRPSDNFQQGNITIELIGHTSKGKRLVCSSFHAG